MDRRTQILINEERIAEYRRIRGEFNSSLREEKMIEKTIECDGYPADWRLKMYRVYFELGDCYFTKDFMCCERARNLYNSVPEDCWREVRELIDGEWCVIEM